MGGNSVMVENEATDRIPDRFGIPDGPDGGSSGPRYLPTGTSLPGSQEALASAVLALKKPTVMALISGDGIAVDSLLPQSDAILFHAYPGGTGGLVLAESILGKHNRFGRLTMSWMPKAFEKAVDFTDFSMTGPIGRSYRYYTGAPLFSFGHGRSFSDHTLTASQSLAPCRWVYEVTIRTRAGPMLGDVVVLAFLIPEKVVGMAAGTPIPKRKLIGAQRVQKNTDGKAKALFDLEKKAFYLTGLDGSRSIRDGAYKVTFSSGIPDEE